MLKRYKPLYIYGIRNGTFYPALVFPLFIMPSENIMMMRFQTAQLILQYQIGANGKH